MNYFNRGGRAVSSFWFLLLLVFFIGQTKLFAFTYGAPTPTPDLHLKDCTPKDYFSDKTQVRPEGPIAFVPCLPLDKRPIQNPMSYKRPCLKISLLTGKGKVVVMQKTYSGSMAQPTATPDPAELKGLKDGEWIAHPGEQSAAPFFFYPAGPAGSSYHLQVTQLGHPENGVLDYQFTTAPLAPAAFDQVKADVMDMAKKLRNLNYRCRIMIQSSFKNWQPNSVPISNSSTITQVFTSDTMKSISTLNGKKDVKVMPRRDVKDTDVLVNGEPWGEDDQNLIFMYDSSGGSTNLAKTFKETTEMIFFNYFDKTTHLLNKTILLSAVGSESLITYKYTLYGSVYFKTESTDIYYTGAGEQQNKSTSITDQIKINP